MTDTVIKGAGNSRTLKTVPNALTLYPDFSAMMAAMVDGTFPIDLGPLNPAGLQQRGDDLNKSTLLTDALCSALGLATTATPSQAMEKLRQLVAGAQSSANAAAKKIITGRYTGNGDSVHFINLGFTPSAVIVFPLDGQPFVSSDGITISYYGGMCLSGYSYSKTYREETLTILDIAGSGFNARLLGTNLGDGYTYHINVNSSTQVYGYIAFR